jgi:hypothetical protein
MLQIIVTEVLTRPQYARPPLYPVNDVVYLRVPGQLQPTGPFIVTAITDSDRYKLKRKDNGEPYPFEVEEHSLCVAT